MSTRWLGATAIHSQDRHTNNLVQSLSALCDNYPQLHAIVNFFDAARVPAMQLVQSMSGNHSRLEGTWVPGMKVRQ